MLRAAMWPALLAVLLFAPSLAPFDFHAVNVLWNAAAAFAFYCLLAALGYSSVVTMTAALLFATHPLHVSAVTPAAAGVTTTLAGVAMLASLVCFAHGHRAVSWSLAAVAVLADDSALGIPALIFVLAFLNCPDNHRVRTAWSAAYPYLLVDTVYIGWMRFSPSQWLSAVAVNWTMIPAAIAHYLLTLFSPWPPAVRDALPGRASVLAAFAILAAWVFLAMRVESLQNDLTLCGALIACPLLLPVLAAPLMPQWSQVQDRYAYVATAGACLLVAILLERLLSPRWMVAVCVALVLAGSLASIRQQRIWHDDQSLFTHGHRIY